MPQTQTEKMQKIMALLREVDFDKLEAEVAADESDTTDEECALYDQNDDNVDRLREFTDNFFIA